MATLTAIAAPSLGISRGASVQRSQPRAPAAADRAASTPHPAFGIMCRLPAIQALRTCGTLAAVC
jgi:hypothetical protein